MTGWYCCSELLALSGIAIRQLQARHLSSWGSTPELPKMTQNSERSRSGAEPVFINPVMTDYLS